MKIMLQNGPRRLFFALLISLLAGCSAPGSRTERIAIHTSHTRTAHFSVEIADTPEQWSKGLMFRRELAADRGMLFLFRPPRELAFWMKNTLIPLDMLFMDEHGRIVNIQENAVPRSPMRIESGSVVAAVLEVPGGTAERLGIHPGDHVAYPKFFHE